MKKPQSTSLLGADSQGSTLYAHASKGIEYRAYSSFGYSQPGSVRSGFAGQPVEGSTGLYLLGNGHRAYRPTLMIMLSPDALSPFGQGGLNCYAYCKGDPINFTDPTGAVAAPGLLKTLGLAVGGRDVLAATVGASVFGLAGTVAVFIELAKIMNPETASDFNLKNVILGLGTSVMAGLTGGLAKRVGKQRIAATETAAQLAIYNTRPPWALELLELQTMQIRYPRGSTDSLRLNSQSSWEGEIFELQRRFARTTGSTGLPRRNSSVRSDSSTTT